MVYSVMTLFPGGWRNYHAPIEQAWGPYLQGSYSMDEAIATTATAIAPQSSPRKVKKPEPSTTK